MQAALLYAQGSPLAVQSIALPEPTEHDVLLQVQYCGICRTDLHVMDGDLAAPKLPLILGHEAIGRVMSVGSAVKDMPKGQLVGVSWMARTCLDCDYCLSGRENLCPNALFTGYTHDGGFAQYTLCDSRFCFRLPEKLDQSWAAPLLCAGLIGWRSFKKAGEGKSLGIYGFGAAAHIITQVAKFQGKEVFAFTSPGDAERQKFALSLGAVWAGDSSQPAPAKLDAGIIFAPAGHLVPKALADLKPGGALVCGGIHMSDIPSFPYSLLWGERTICSVANLTKADGQEFFEVAAEAQVKPHVVEYSLSEVNTAISDFRHGKVHGAAVLVLE